MILPIVAYGDPVLRKVATNVDTKDQNLAKLIENMWDTMYNANGVGLAAPQVGLPMRIFIIDTTPFAKDEDLNLQERESLNGFKQVFINAQIEEESGKEWSFNEGCLSIPDVREDVVRKPTIRISYLDKDFKPKKGVYEGLLARVIQHEYDHIEGVLFTDRISSLKKRLISGRLKNISKGKINVDYRMRFPEMKKTR